MEGLNMVLAWILQIGGVAVILFGAFFWIQTAVKSRSTARSFMALVFTFIFFIVMVLRPNDFTEATLRWFIIIYGAIMGFYIVARMFEHREEIREGKGKKK